MIGLFLLQASDSLRHKARLRQWNATAAQGRRGEDMAHRFLQRSGYVVVARNYRTRGGSAEVDIVCYEDSTIIFVEVKTRQSEEFGPPDRAVDAEKQEHIFRAAGEYLRRAELPWSMARFDIVSIVSTENGTVRHLKDAFRRSQPL